MTRVDPSTIGPEETNDIPHIEEDVSLCEDVQGNVRLNEAYDNQDVMMQIALLKTQKQDRLTAGDGITIEDNVISTRNETASWGRISGTITDQTDLMTELSGISDRVGDNTDAIEVLAESKANVGDSYTKDETDSLLEGKQDAGAYAEWPYTKSYIDEADRDLQSQIDGMTPTVEGTAHYLEEHKADRSNPHRVTKSQVGLSNVDNTADINKPISAATQGALNGKANVGDSYTKTETDALLADKQDTGDYATNGALAQGLSGKANVGDSYTKSETDTLLYQKAAKASVYTRGETDNALALKANSADVYTKTEVDELHSDINTAIDEVSSSVAALDGNTYKKTYIDTQLATKQGKLTAGAGIGISDNNTISCTVPGFTVEVVQVLPSSGRAGAIYLVPILGSSGQNIYNEFIWVNTQWEQIGTTQIDLSPYATWAATKQYIDTADNGLQSQIDDVSYTAEGTAHYLEEHKANTSNPHRVTKSQVGLSNVNNTSDMNKPVSTATQAALNEKANVGDSYTKSEADALLADKANASDVYTQTEVDTKLYLKAAKTSVYTKGETDSLLAGKQATGDYATNMALTQGLSGKADVGVAYTKSETDTLLAGKQNAGAYMDWPNTKSYIDTKASTLQSQLDDVSDVADGAAHYLEEHTANTSNPHHVTKSQVGLSNVNNTSDANKPISTATQTALNGKANVGDSYTKSETDTLLEGKQDSGDYATNEALAGKVSTSLKVNGHALTSDVTVTKSDLGLGNVNNTSDANKPISTATQTALNAKVPTTRKVNGHALSADVTVTKSDIGLGNVNNTSDLNKPISTAVRTALSAKANESDTVHIYYDENIEGTKRFVDGLIEIGDENSTVEQYYDINTRTRLKAVNGTGDVVAYLDLYAQRNGMVSLVLEKRRKSTGALIDSTEIAVL